MKLKCGFNNVIIDRDIARTYSFLLINISIHTIVFVVWGTVQISQDLTPALSNLLCMLNLKVSVANFSDSTIRFLGCFCNMTEI